MKLKTLLIASSLLFSSGLGLGVMSNTYDNYVKDSELQNVKKATYTILTRRGQGTGVVVRSDSNGSLIVTNKHVCDGARQTADELRYQQIPVSNFVLVFAKPLGAKPVIGQIISVAMNLDLCMIHLDFKKLAVVKIAKEDSKINQKIYTHGSPYGQEGTTERGKVTGKEYSDEMQHIAAKLRVRPGASGSGVYNEKSELIGIVARMGKSSPMAREPDICLYVSLAHLKLFLAQFGILE